MMSCSRKRGRLTRHRFPEARLREQGVALGEPRRVRLPRLPRRSARLPAGRVRAGAVGPAAVAPAAAGARMRGPSPPPPGVAAGKWTAKTTPLPPLARASRGVVSLPANRVRLANLVRRESRGNREGLVSRARGVNPAKPESRARAGASVSRAKAASHGRAGNPARVRLPSGETMTGTKSRAATRGGRSRVAKRVGDRSSIGPTAPARITPVRTMLARRGGVRKGAATKGAGTTDAARTGGVPEVADRRVGVAREAAVPVAGANRGVAIAEVAIARRAMRFAGVPRCGPRPSVAVASPPGRTAGRVKGTTSQIGRLQRGNPAGTMTGETTDTEVGGAGVADDRVGVAHRAPCREDRVEAWVAAGRGVRRVAGCPRCLRRRVDVVAGGVGPGDRVLVQVAEATSLGHHSRGATPTSIRRPTTICCRRME